MGKKGKERAKEWRRQRLEEIAELREVPYSPSERWWSGETAAVVTGANRGIGLEIARQLAAHGLRVVLAARDAERGRAAAERLREEEGLCVEPRQLDVTDSASVDAFANWVSSEYGGIDILVRTAYVMLAWHIPICEAHNLHFEGIMSTCDVKQLFSNVLNSIFGCPASYLCSIMSQVNNAGVNFNTGADNSVESAEEVIATNYFGTKRMIKAMIPIMKPSPFGARILNVSSRLGRVNGRRNRVGDEALRERLLQDDCLSEELIDGMVTKFLEQVKLGTWSLNGWPQMYTDYSLSKLAVNAYTRLIAKRILDKPEGEKIYINCFCPGWVKTAMTGWAGNISAEEAADTGVWVVLLPPEKAPNGKFFAERREISF
uniref:(+)-neomenthol dehydrogenase n=1 Tax=Ananas comosus var. bracteatus TaxID=296719 RepID=A0A6V7QUX2_ANACO